MSRASANTSANSSSSGSHTKDAAPPARSRARKAREALYRQLILEAAETVFAEQGFASTKMQDIARAAGLSLKTLYATFDGKLQLFTEVRELRRDILLKALSAEAKKHESTVDRLMHGVRIVVEFLVSHPHFLRIQLREGSAWAFEPRMSEGPGGNRWREVMTFQTRMFRRGVKEGVFVDENPEALARMVSAITQVQAALWLEQGGADDPAPLVARVQEHIRRAFCAHP